MKPDAELARDLQRCQCLGVVAGVFVRGAIAGDAQLMKEVAGFAGHNTRDLQAPQQVGMGLLSGGKQAGAGGGELGERFAELAELDKGGAGIFLEVALGQRAEAHELQVVGGEECEVRRLQIHSEASILPRRMPAELQRNVSSWLTVVVCFIASFWLGVGSPRR